MEFNKKKKKKRKEVSYITGRVPKVTEKTLYSILQSENTTCTQYIDFFFAEDKKESSCTVGSPATC